MRITVHRGSKQIGGCAVEIRTDSTRIIIDVGEELDSDFEQKSPLKIDGVTCGNPDCNAVFFTHYHGDHIGLCDTVLSGIPMYMGCAAKEIYTVLQTRLSKVFPEAEETLNSLERISTFHALQRITVGDIAVTPIMVDHSAYDAYMFVIEAEGKRILHTGDFRTHGFRGKGVFACAERFIGKVDYLITEGTTLSRPDADPETEYMLLERAKDYLSQYKYVFVLCSSTNIDRLAGVKAAAESSRKWLVADGFQKDVLNVAEKYGKRYSRLYDFSKVRVYGENLDEYMARYGFAMAVRAVPYFDGIIKKFDPDQSIILYSMWKGYLGNSPNLDAFLKGRRWEYFHTSGHASQKAIRRLIEIVDPAGGVIPIHTECPEKIRELCGGHDVIFPKDGEEIVI